MDKRKLLVSFSAGTTSAFMAWWCRENLSDEYNIVNVFANTGEEREETLVFADKCDKYFDLDLVWVEADVQPKHRVGTKAKIVSFETASRNGEPFEEMIKKYGIPNQSYPHCTRELKLRPIQDYVRQLGWKKKDYYTAIGIRADEIDRQNSKAHEKNIIYPLISMIPTNKNDVNKFWQQIPFQLELKGYEGNCKVCWKKSLRKLLTIADENPHLYTHFWLWQYRYQQYTPDSRKHNADPPYRFYRNNLTIEEIIQMAKNEDFNKATDDSIYSKEKETLHEYELDLPSGCSEHCEIYSED